MDKNEFLIVKKMILSNIIFLVLNFSALYLGVILANEGGSSDWYSNLTRAPWEPDGWVFGVVWTSIMICFSVYMSINWNRTINKKKLLIFYSLQYVLNVFWNPIFFGFHYILFGFIIILMLTFLIGYLFFYYKSDTNYYSILILPYFIWLIIATSLNGYIFIYN